MHPQSSVPTLPIFKFRKKLDDTKSVNVPANNQTSRKAGLSASFEKRRGDCADGGKGTVAKNEMIKKPYLCNLGKLDKPLGKLEIGLAGRGIA